MTKRICILILDTVTSSRLPVDLRLRHPAVQAVTMQPAHITAPACKTLLHIPSSHRGTDTGTPETPCGGDLVSKFSSASESVVVGTNYTHGVRCLQ
jgi:hypothetical protein